jgi:hypothetical protein
MGVISGPSIVFIFAVAMLPFILASILSLLLRVSFHLVKVPLPKLRTRFGATLCQVVLGIAILFALNYLQAHPILQLGVALGATILVGLFFYKLFFKLEWKQALKVWGVAAAFQIFTLPIVATVLFYAEMVILFMLFPVQPRL